MKLSGTATIGHPVRDVYAALTDPAILVRTLPGCQRLELVGPDRYAATMVAGVGAITGLFEGQVRLTDQSAPDSFTLHASGAGSPGTVDAVAHVRLVASPGGGTEVHYAADATVGGMIGGVGQRMLAGVARRTAGEFFAAVDRELAAAAAGRAEPSASAVSPEAAASTDSAAAPGLAPLPVTPAGSAGESGSAAVPSGAAVTATAEPGAQAEPTAAPAGASGRAVWTRPAAAPDPARQRIRELLIATAFGAGIALLGVLIGALVAGW
ncbi:MAG: carbon monoxide dehydrogenase [Micromonosporaceae bacterium]|nr:carbon monoxide dehydrogenase [Micromonosporaceae bacterium]